jgi:hypothetical protein
VDFRQYWVIQDRHTGLFLTEELGFTSLYEKAGRLYDVHQAVDIAQSNIESYSITSSYEKIDHNESEPY